MMLDPTPLKVGQVRNQDAMSKEKNNKSPALKYHISPKIPTGKYFGKIFQYVIPYKCHKSMFLKMSIILSACVLLCLLCVTGCVLLFYNWSYKDSWDK